MVTKAFFVSFIVMSSLTLARYGVGGVWLGRRKDSGTGVGSQDDAGTCKQISWPEERVNSSLGSFDVFLERKTLEQCKKLDSTDGLWRKRLRVTR